MKLEWDFKEFVDFANQLSDRGKLDTHLERATKEIAHELLKRIKQFTPIGDTWELINGWDKNDLAVHKVKNGYEVLLINSTMYATWVNDGHRQRPGRFIPGYFSGGRFYYDRSAKGGMVLKEPFVQGRFFVEKGILSLNNTSLIEQIIINKLQKWWDSV